jgi:hypothetical protein
MPGGSFSVVDLDGISIHGRVPMEMLTSFARYDWGGFVFGERAVLQRIDLAGSSSAIASFRQCLGELGA